MLRLWTWTVVLGLLLGTVSLAADQWTPPTLATASIDLPFYEKPHPEMGPPTAWLTIPVRSQASVAFCRPPHTWNGPDDASFITLAAWNADGLHLFVTVRDDDVRQAYDGLKMWQQDCLEIVVDARPAATLMTAPKGEGFVKFFVRPPVGDRPAELLGVDPGTGNYAGLKATSTVVAGGYQVHLTIPWTVFPNFEAKKGVEIGLGMGLDDYDARDGDRTQPLMIAYAGNASMSGRPDKLLRLRLADTVNQAQRFRLFTSLRAPGVAKDSTVATVLQDEAAPAPDRFAVTLEDVTGAVIAQTSFRTRKQTVERVLPFVKRGGLVKARTARGSRSYDLPITWPEYLPNGVALADGYYTLTVTLFGRDGATLGTLEQPVVRVAWAATLGERETRRLRTGLSGEVLLAAVGRELALAAEYEKLKRAIEKGDAAMAVGAAKALEARHAALYPGPEPAMYLRDANPLHALALLERGNNPDVVVQFPSPDAAAVTFYCGSIPLATVYARQYATPEAAQAAAKPDPKAPATLYTTAIGNRRFDSVHPVKAVAEYAVGLVAKGETITREESDKVRQLLVAALAPKVEARALPAGQQLYTGDVHMHTFYSDGNCSPAGLLMQGMHARLDFAVMSDHNTLDGAKVVIPQLKKAGFAFPVTMGQEITCRWAHFNAYPVSTLVNWEQPLYGIVRDAHAQGAVIQWNHPGFPGGEWDKAQQERILGDTALDAWEHYTTRYEQWKADGKAPLLMGSTDTHSGTFETCERTIILAPSPEGIDLAEAVRLGNVALVSEEGPAFVYGPDHMTAYVWAALIDGKGLRERKAAAMAGYVAKADLGALVTMSQPRVVKPE